MLTKKQIKLYKPMIKSKLEEMGVKSEIGYTQTGSFRMAPKLIQEDGKMEVKQVKTPNYRASNLHKNLTKKLLKLSPEAIEKFLETAIPSKEESEDVSQTAEKE